MQNLIEALEQRASLYREMEQAHEQGNHELFHEIKKRYLQADATVTLFDARQRNEVEPGLNEDQTTTRTKRGFGDPKLGRAIITAAQQGFENLRGITSSTGSGAIQDPLIRTDYFAAEMNKHDFFRTTGIQIVNPNNYSSWPVVSDPAATWQSAEGDQINESSMTITGRKIEYKTCAIMVKASKQFMRDGGDLAANIINAALLKSFANELGRVVLSGNGTAEPEGLDTLSGVEEHSVSGGQITTWAPFLNGLAKVHANNAIVENCSWIAGTNGMLQIESLDDSTGQYLQKPPVLDGMPYVYSSHVLETYSSSTRTRAYIGDFSNCLVAVSGPFLLPMTQRYGDYLMDAFILWAGVDLLVKRPAEICKITNIGLL